MQKLVTAIACMASIASVAYSQEVTVGLAAGEYDNLADAVDAVRTDPETPNIITFIDEGPFIQNGRLLLNEFETGPDDMIIQGAEGIRPIIICDLENDTRRSGMVYLRKQGNLTIKDLIILPPAEEVTPENYTTKVAEAGLEIQVDNLQPTSITLQNILISSNNGNNQPVASLDGLTPPVTTPETVSFRDEGIYVQSQPNDAQLHYLNMTGVVVSGVNGDQGSDGIRGFPDGTPGSQWIIGPGTVVSYNGGHGFQPGGTTNFSVEIRGEENNPVRLINNAKSGINITNQNGAPSGLTHVEWCIIANNAEHGINAGDIDTSTDFENVTIANNGSTVMTGPPDPNAVSYTFSNVIAAGDGAASDPDNVIRLVQSGTGTAAPSSFTASQSAIVLDGIYTLNTTDYGGDGIDSDTNYSITTSAVLHSDPEFLSLDPANASFAVVSNQDYGTAGPAGQPLTGGASFAQSAISEWQLF